MARRTFNSIESTADQAEAFVQQGRWAEAERHYRELIGQTHVINYEYDDWLRRLGEIYRHLGRAREASFVYLYLHYFDMARGQLAGDEHVALRARLAEIEKKWTEAAHALPAGEAAGARGGRRSSGRSSYAEATTAWKGLLHAPGLTHRPTRRRSCTSTTGSRRCALDAQSAEARRALIESQRKLEQVADDFEQVGELERAFDCFQILLKLGKEIGAVREPRRGLRQLHPRAARRQPQVLRPAVLRGLHQARARARASSTRPPRSIRRPRRSRRAPGLPYDRHYQHKSALTWMQVRREVRRDRRAGADGRERAARGRVAALGGRRLPGGARVLRAARRPRAARAREASGSRRSRSATRASRRRRSSCPALPDYLKQQHAYADIWFVDLLEWEMDGDPFAVAASIVGDLRYPNGIRRRALVVLLITGRRAGAQRGRRDRDARRGRATSSASCSRTRRCRRSRSCSRRRSRRSGAPRCARCASSTSSARS